MRTRRKQSKQTLIATEETTRGVFTDEELKSRLEVAMREALSVVEQSAQTGRQPSSFETTAEETLYLVNDFDH